MQKYSKMLLPRRVFEPASSSTHRTLKPQCSLSRMLSQSPSRSAFCTAALLSSERRPARSVCFRTMTSSQLTTRAVFGRCVLLRASR